MWPVGDRIIALVADGDAVGDEIGDARVVMHDEIPEHGLKCGGLGEFRVSERCRFSV